MLKGMSYDYCKEQVTIGSRRGCDLLLNDGGVEPEHARILADGAELVIHNRSESGVKVNGKFVERQALHRLRRHDLPGDPGRRPAGQASQGRCGRSAAPAVCPGRQLDLQESVRHRCHSSILLGHRFRRNIRCHPTQGAGGAGVRWGVRVPLGWPGHLRHQVHRSRSLRVADQAHRQARRGRSHPGQERSGRAVRYPSGQVVAVPVDPERQEDARAELAQESSVPTDDHLRFGRGQPGARPGAGALREQESQPVGVVQRHPVLQKGRGVLSGLRGHHQGGHQRGAQTGRDRAFRVLRGCLGAGVHQGARQGLRRGGGPVRVPPEAGPGRQEPGEPVRPHGAAERDARRVTCSDCKESFMAAKHDRRNHRRERRSDSPARAPRRRRSAGQAALEFLLLLACFILPMAILAFGIRRYQRELFDIVSWFLSLPIP
ncbi:MAG: FHA domain-containing protein [Candidatus Riflebacteria bacterium]|nr:FHA domain-containing protein [Candidatus Riflebacteria bacterium]